jgi:hypothetical protein
MEDYSKIGLDETNVNSFQWCTNPNGPLGRVGDHAGLTRQEMALLDAPAHLHFITK